MSGPRPIGPLPPHLRREQHQLAAAGIHDWDQLARLEDGQLRHLGAGGGASEARLIKLRGQARLVSGLELQPAEAALLLYAGIADVAGLAAADPHQLLRQLGRLQRSLTGPAAPPPDPAMVRQWILRARRRTGRSAN